MAETPEEFEERIALMAELIGLSSELEISMIRALDEVRQGIRTHRKLLVELANLIEGGM